MRTRIFVVSTTTGFEPAQGDPSGLAVHRLNRSATLSSDCSEEPHGNGQLHNGICTTSEHNRAIALVAAASTLGQTTSGRLDLSRMLARTIERRHNTHAMLASSAKDVSGESRKQERTGRWLALGADRAPQRQLCVHDEEGRTRSVCEHNPTETIIICALAPVCCLALHRPGISSYVVSPHFSILGPSSVTATLVQGEKKEGKSIRKS